MTGKDCGRIWKKAFPLVIFCLLTSRALRFKASMAENSFPVAGRGERVS